MSQMNRETDKFPVVSISNRSGRFPVVLVCEHASNHIPEEFDGLGLNELAKQSHVAWDPGARQVGEHMSEFLDCPLVSSEVSRLIYDCNRPPEAESAMPARSEVFDIPGNVGLSASQRADRTAKFYLPFEQAVADTIAAFGERAILVTLHSFTRVYNGEPRAVELGILHDTDSRLADAMMADVNMADANMSGIPDPSTMNVQYNMPYGIGDGVTHTLQTHGIANGILNVMIEIRNDLVENPQQCRDVAKMLSGMLTRALYALSSGKPAKWSGT